MQPDQVIGQLLGSLVGRKRSRRSSMLGMAMGGRRGGSLLTGGTLLTAAGLVWGALESMQKSTVPRGAAPAVPPPVPPSSPPSSASPVVTPPPLPGTQPGVGVVPPPLPVTDAPSAEVNPEALLPLLQVAIAAARADGELSGEERQVIEEQASSLGLEAALAGVLQARPSPDTYTGAFTTDEQRRAAYAIAWTVIRGDGVVSPGERMYLTQLARALRLPHEDVETIEREALGKEQPS